jgi:hypothetical protein
MVELPYAFATVVAVLAPILHSAVANLAIVPFIFLEVEQLIFL